MKIRNLSIFIVEDNPDEVFLIRQILSRAPETRFEVTVAATLEEALPQLRAHQPDILILDLNLPDSGGIETFQRVFAVYPKLPIIIATALPEKGVALEAIYAGAQDFLVKGQYQENTLLRSIDYALERSRLQGEIRTLSLTDGLTLLYNQRGFLNLAEQQLKIHQRYYRPFVLFFVDVDDFKEINDIYGTSAGDRILKQVAALLKMTFRRSDILSRYGGGEFAAIAIETTPSHVAMILGRLYSNLKTLSLQEKHPGGEISLSVGHVFYNGKDPMSLDRLIQEADQKMHDCKKAKID